MPRPRILDIAAKLVLGLLGARDEFEDKIGVKRMRWIDVQRQGVTGKSSQEVDQGSELQRGSAEAEHRLRTRHRAVSALLGDALVTPMLLTRLDVGVVIM